MIWALPKSSLVFITVDASVWSATPIPFTIFIVNQFAADVLPASYGMIKSVSVTKVLVYVQPSNHIFCLYPPVQVIINCTFVKVCLVYHRTIRIDTLLRCLCHYPYDRFHPFKYLFVIQYKSSFVHQPGTFNVVSVALQLSRSACPVIFEKKVKMMCLWVQYLFRKYVYDIPQCLLNTNDGLLGNRRFAFPKRSEQIGIRFYDVQVSILRLRVVLIMFRKPHISYRQPISCHGFDISVVFRVKGVLFNALEKLQRIVQCLPVTCSTRIF